MELLKRLVAEKAKAVGLEHDQVRYEKPKTTFETEGMDISVDRKGNDIIVHQQGLEGVSDDMLELFAESGVSCLMVKSGRGMNNMIHAIGNTLCKTYALEVWQAYHQLQSGSFMIEAFGQDHFDTFNLFGLDDLIGSMEWYLQSVPVFEAGCQVVVTLKREYLKATLMSELPEFKPVLARLCAPYRPVFEAIDATGLDWSDRSKLQFLLTANDLINTNPPASYVSGTLQLSENWRRPSLQLRKQGFIPQRIYAQAKRIDETIKTIYHDQPHEQAQVD